MSHDLSKKQMKRKILFEEKVLYSFLSVYKNRHKYLIYLLFVMYVISVKMSKTINSDILVINLISNSKNILKEKFSFHC